MSNTQEIAKRIHAAAWEDAELDATELVDLMCEDNGVNAAIEKFNLAIELEKQNPRVFVDHMAEFERLRPSPMFKNPIDTMFNKIRGIK